MYHLPILLIQEYLEQLHDNQETKSITLVWLGPDN